MTRMNSIEFLSVTDLDKGEAIYVVFKTAGKEVERHWCPIWPRHYLADCHMDI